MNQLVLGNLVHRPLRSLLSALAVAIEVIMILSIAGIMFGILNGSRAQNSGAGWDMIAHPGAATALMNTSGAAASVKVAQVLESLPHVAVASPVNIKLTAGSSLENIYGIDYPSYNALRPFHFIAGGPFERPYDVIIDDFQAASGTHPHVGDTLKILGQDFRVSGIFEHGKGARKFIPLQTMDEIDGNPGKASAFFIRTDDLKNQNLVRGEIAHYPGLQQYSVQTLEEFLSTLTPEHLGPFNIGLKVVIGLAVIIGFLAIFQSMYTAVLERTREIGILKSLGAGRTSIVGVVLRETLLLAAAGCVLGVLVTYAVRSGLHTKFPTLSFQLTGKWVLWAVLIAMGSSLLGALYPALKAARKDPIDALGYE